MNFVEELRKIPIDQKALRAEFCCWYVLNQTAKLNDINTKGMRILISYVDEAKDYESIPPLAQSEVVHVLEQVLWDRPEFAPYREKRGDLTSLVENYDLYCSPNEPINLSTEKASIFLRRRAVHAKEKLEKIGFRPILDKKPIQMTNFPEQNEELLTAKQISIKKIPDIIKKLKSLTQDNTLGFADFAKRALFINPKVFNSKKETERVMAHELQHFQSNDVRDRVVLTPELSLVIEAINMEPAVNFIYDSKNKYYYRTSLVERDAHLAKQRLAESYGEPEASFKKSLSLINRKAYLRSLDPIAESKIAAERFTKKAGRTHGWQIA